MINEVLSNSILAKLEEISDAFSGFQKESGLLCPTGCGKCCFNPEISCAPYELLPLAFHLLKTNKAEEVLLKARTITHKSCPFLFVFDEKSGLGNCSQYQFRPFICRAFGVGARHDKNNEVNFIFCSVLKNKKEVLSNLDFSKIEIPFIEDWKRKLEVLDPNLQDTQVPITEALIYILEKVLLWDTYQG
jgi:Fe-S-cluster containining protein